MVSKKKNGVMIITKTRINEIGGSWTNIKNKCRTTTGKEYTQNVPDSKFRYNLLISEHSPIRLLTVDWSWKGIKSWVATHWSRHCFQKFISTQRTDRTGIDRDKMPQDAPVNFDGCANAQNLIDAWRKRLCYQSSVETRECAEDFKRTLYEYEPELARVLVPNCVYRGFCPEFMTCGYWNIFYSKINKEILASVERYDIYNEQFFQGSDS